MLLTNKPNHKVFLIYLFFLMNFLDSVSSDINFRCKGVPEIEIGNSFSMLD